MKFFKGVKHIRKKTFKYRIKNVDRSYRSFINFQKISKFSELIKIMIPLDLFTIILISLMVDIPAKQEIYPLMVSAIFIFNIKKFITQYAYFFHFFIDQKEEQFLRKSKKELFFNFLFLSIITIYL